MTLDPELHKRPYGCDHCGTVERALTEWSQQIKDTCKCWCHIRRAEVRKTGKSKK